ncbi:MAG: sulfatase-like hydrolase/transferase [Desulfopila sp.]
MKFAPTNLLIVMVDEMSAKAVGCYGNTSVKTPNIDDLAARGVRFQDAYTNSPICMPARAALATGQYPHRTGYWDNVFAYDGKVSGWGHRLQNEGHRVTSIGKLHYLDADIPAGIDEQLIPMHLVAGGDVFGLERENPPKRLQSKTLAEETLAGHSGYTRYDLQITELTETWFGQHLPEWGGKPWVTLTSFIAPHFPLTVPQEYIDIYRETEISLYGKSLATEGEVGKWWRKFRDGYNFDDYFRDDAHRQQSLTHYYALCSFADHNVGRVLAALEESGAEQSTRVLFIADHGDNMGARGLWGKSTMYRESVNVPMIMAGPDLPQGKVCTTPVSLIDVYQTVLDVVGLELTEEEEALPGTSLLQIANRPFDDREREVFSEYHASCAPSATFMLRAGQYKYIHYTGAGAELFDLEADPEEERNLAELPEMKEVVCRFQKRLLEILDPEQIDRQVKTAQHQRLDELGGLEAVIAKGGVPHTPPPGEEPEFIGG